MADNDKTFKKAPPRKALKGRTVGVTDEVRKKYEAEIKRRDEHEKQFGQHLAAEDKQRR